jgi:hypothetical protein
MTELIHARAYRDGRLVCDRALVTVTACDERLGLAPRERRRMTVRFVHGIDPAFRAQLMQVLRRRGHAPGGWPPRSTRSSSSSTARGR